MTLRPAFPFSYSRGQLSYLSQWQKWSGQHIPLTVATPWHMKEEMDGCSSPLSSTGLARLVPSLTGSALACYPGRVQDLLSHTLQLVRDRSSSPTPVTPGASSLACLRWQGVRRGWTFFSYPCPHLADGEGRDNSSALRSSWPAHLCPLTGTGLLCCPGER